MSHRLKVRDFITWFTQNGGVWSDSIDLWHDEEFGYHVITNRIIPAPTTEEEPSIACPFGLCITQPSARSWILSARDPDGGDADLGTETETRDLGLNERQWIASYLVVHLIGKDEPGVIPSHVTLPHLPYISILPSRTDLLTPLLWSEKERSLLQGSNLDHAVADREALWKNEWEGARGVVCTRGLGGLKDEFGWDRWVLANSYITSRSFPSSLLRLNNPDLNPTLQPVKTDSDEPYPFLLPGIDLLNHRRAEPVSWTSLTGKDGKGRVGFGSRRGYKAGEQVWNNYGPKGNEELLMAYGFVIPNNPDDTSAVKLGIQQALPPDAQVILDEAGLKVDETHHVRFDDPVATGERGQVDSPLPERLTRVVRIACGGSDKPQKTLDQMLKAIRSAADPRENEYLDEVQVEMQAMEVLEGLFQSKAGQAQSRLWRINARKGEEGIRQHVWEACREYAKGQHEILQSQFYQTTLELGDWEEGLQGYIPEGDDYDEDEDEMDVS